MFKEEQKFSGQLDLMYKELEKSINDKNDQMIVKITQEIRILTQKVYFLSVLFEINGIVENRGTKGSKSEISAISGATMSSVDASSQDVLFDKKMAAKCYFNIIKDWSKDKKASDEIQLELNKEPNEINVDTIKENLKKSFPEFSEEFKDKF
jgi:hypothetical protein